MVTQGQLKEAVLWKKDGDNKTDCFLCNWHCSISPGKTGRCFVRRNIEGTLYSLNYDKVCAANPDPIEKKPLFHFQPGSRSFSIAAPGCNFRCEFCQNWQISQMPLEGQIDGQALTPQLIVKATVQSQCKSIAYTYTEPTIFMELCAETGKLAKEKGLANVFVSNGFMTIEAVDFVKDWLNGINIDLKAFTEDYYKRLCKARLQPVLDTIEYIAKNTDIWLEITTLIVPGENDSDEELKQMADFLVSRAGADVPWHISRFFPQYHYTDSVPTPIETMQKAYSVGKEAGLKYIYLGNVAGGGYEDTVCPGCGEVLIQRSGYYITKNKIKDSRCPACSQKIPGYQL
ncbi:MAG: AmmeMemoRadiSam system radical SAM enzyme [Phycisphaerae bacterium]|nr:AmmeMemoRadiSam system radical SAM enzyme [Phycisphaerae bacterium]